MPQLIKIAGSCILTAENGKQVKILDGNIVRCTKGSDGTAILDIDGQSFTVPDKLVEPLPCVLG